MVLSEDKTYRTRDGTRTGIKIEKCEYSAVGAWREVLSDAPKRERYWFRDGKTVANLGGAGEHPLDLVEEAPAAPPAFSYAACPVGADGRRRAVTRDGREVVLLCDDGPGLGGALVGFIVGDTYGVREWHPVHNGLRVPPPPKRVVWVNLFPSGYSHHYSNETEADAAQGDGGGTRLGGRAHRIEVDP